MDHSTQRRFLWASGIVSTVGLAGCLGIQGGSDVQDTDGDGVIDSEDYAPRDPDVQRKEQIQTNSAPTETKQPADTETDTTAQIDDRSSGLFQEGFEDGNLTENPVWTRKSVSDQLRLTVNSVWEGTYSLQMESGAGENPTPNILTADIGRIPANNYELTGIYRQDDGYTSIASFIGLQNSKTDEWIGAGCEADGYAQLRHYDGTGRDPYTLKRSADGHTVDSNYTNQGGTIKSTDKWYKISVSINGAGSTSELIFSETDGSRIYKQEIFDLRQGNFDTVLLWNVSESGAGSAFFDKIKIVPY
jgi:hypothetical protein